MESLIEKLKQNPKKFTVNHERETIKSVLDYLDSEYYNGEGILDDSVYDFLSDFYYGDEQKVSIGADVLEGKVSLPINMGSMDKVKPDTKALSSFLSKFTNPKCISEKLDGISFLIALENNKVNAYTRGNSTIGQNGTSVLKFINLSTGIQSMLEFCDDNNCYVRGELIMSKPNWIKLKSSSSNARNYVGGKVRRMIVKPESITPADYWGIEFVAFELISHLPLSISKQLNILDSMGFKTVKREIIKSVTQSVLVEKLIQFRQESEYDIDGIIVQDDKYYPRYTSKNPEYAKAFKMDGDTFITTVIDVEWNPSWQGKIKPIVHLEPVVTPECTIRKATGNNAKFIVTHGIGPGASVEIIRSGEVIPKIIRVIKKVKPSLPKIAFEWDENGTDIMVDMENSDGNDDAMDQIEIKKIERFVSHTDIGFYKTSTVEKGYYEGIDSIEKFVTAKQSDFLKIEGIKSKSADKIIESRKIALTNIPFVKLAAALPYFEAVGSRRLQAIYDEIPEVLDLADYEDQLYSKLMNVDGIADKIAKIIVDGMPNLIEFLEFFQKYYPIKFKNEAPTSNTLDGKTFVFSGKRDKKLEDKIVDMGGKVSSSVSKNTSYVVVDSMDSSSGKVTKAKSLGVQLVLFTDLPNMLK